ncbi:MAG: hypothetical protein FWC16_05940 [Defluviitaleaceae bacterium]|nr:hypothetical protein [Defluviitaleaceae bacterium]MCL2274449.1 hypothetical protein [Defluviitaleaceae bacterium]
MNEKKLVLSDFHFIKEVAIGSINPNVMFSEEAREQQLALLNKCIGTSPKGTIIGKDISIGRYKMGEHELTMQKTIYHIGFLRKPVWIAEEERRKTGAK